MYNIIIHPKTNNAVSIHSPLGKSLIQKYIQQIGGKKLKPIVSKTICKKYNKKKTPSCAEQRNCRWIKNKKGTNGCFSDEEAIQISDRLKIKKILGPVTFYLWDITCPNGTNKKILMMGDIHTDVIRNCPKDNNCLDLPDFIGWILNKTHKCIDLIIERPPNQLSRPLFQPSKTGFDLKTPQHGGFRKKMEVLPQIEEYFYGCAFHSRSDLLERNNKLKCQHKNLRYHNFDVRFSYDDDVDGEFERNDVYLDQVIGGWKKAEDRVYNHAEDYSILADYILGLPIKNKVKLDRVLYKCLADSSTPHDFIKIKEHMKEFRKLIKKEYKKYQKTSKLYFSKKIDLLQLIKEIVRKNYLKKLQDYDDEEQELTQLFTDLYILCRMFMEFNTNKNKKSRTPSKCKLIESGKKTINISPNKIIIFAGADHIELYNKVLEKTFGKRRLIYSTSKEHKSKIIRINSIKSTKRANKNTTPTVTFNDIIDKFLE